MKTINIGREFHDDPSGRYYSDGEGSGEEFREEKLLPAIKALKEGENIEITIDDNVEGYGSSFLVEAFAGLVKYGYFNKEYVKSVIKIKFTDQDFKFYEERIYEYIDQAKFNSVKYVSTKGK